ncbi:DUF2306 domain-containing protein [Kibdelosporangium phytohabitans]|uniref:Uncharacterized protein n=1 Tax=Kibdelosporangium phytohabitans TaxID=860235 RepID=A0A0N9IB14_9PSEU|nr:DUF2306 domain-containing protein [Kibdelosporangium phytohabitans]ALG11993.1 hypothetical protein AOZ06_38575 [Kibdelosporangium phytohabitans]MBE1463461.1 hypothetical protein [Kibdelosporangium phytohabitans]
MIGPFQFAAKLRARRPQLHRVLGRVYMVSIVVAAVSSSVAVVYSTEGVSAQVAFCLLTGAIVAEYFIVPKTISPLSRRCERDTETRRSPAELVAEPQS